MNNEPALLKSISGDAMALQAVTARGRLEGLLFELTVEQRYHNPAATNVEAVYTFPLPLAAVLLDFEVELGGRKLAGVVVEKRAAEARYEETIEKGDTAIMLERAADGLCTVNLGNLVAGEEATVRYRYAQLLRFEQGSVRLAVPTVIAPRYGDSAAAGLQPHQQPLTDVAAGYPFALTIDLRGPIARGRIASPSHRIETTAGVDAVTVSLAKGAWLDRDFVLAVDALGGISLAMLARDGDGYVALASVCADVPRDATEAPLRLKVLVDCSGSMNGDSIEAAKRALHRIFAGLGPADRFTLSRFGSTVHHDVAAPTPATPEAIRAAAERLAAMEADLGGTEMEKALRSVFALGGSGRDRDPAADVLLITDGEIWHADSLVAAAKAAGQRVFTVGIGAAPAEGVLRRLAEATGGACEFVAPDEDAEAGILRTFGRLRGPRVERAEVAWPGTPAWVTPTPRGLFGGETIHVFAGFADAPAGTVAIRLVSACDREPLTAAVTLPAAIDAADTLPRMAAAQRIETADAESRLGLALQYRLLTERTNFLVVHERAEGEKALDLPQLQRVAQMHAAGWGGVGSVRAGQLLHSRARPLQACLSVDIEPALKASLDVVRERVPTKRKDRQSPGPFGGDVDGPELLAPSPGRGERFVPPLDHGLERFVRVLDGQHLAGGQPALPHSLTDLRRLGVDEAILAALGAAIAEGFAEEVVVRAFLEALEPLARQIGASRQLQRALRNRFAAGELPEAAREAVRAIVAGVSLRSTAEP